MITSDNNFLNVILNMKENGQLDEAEYEKLYYKYLKYVEDIKNKNATLEEKKKQGFIEKQLYVPPENYNRTPQPGPQNVPVQEFQQPSYYIPPEKAEKKVLTKDEIRVRNLSWILNIGVILVILSGIIFGTSSWKIMTSQTKTALLFCASIFFFGVSTLARRVLKIERASNAFWILGNLMLPVALLSIGFFRLFGDYFSLGGDGRYLFAMISSAICMPVFVRGIYKFKSKAFVWIALINASFFWAMGVYSFSPQKQVAVLFILLFNGVLIFAKKLFKNKISLEIVFNETNLFFQLNLVFGTLLSFFSFTSSNLYSVNIILASFFFLALSVSEDMHVYDYIFGVLFNCGVFLLARDTQNLSFSFMMIMAVGVLLTMITMFMNLGESRKSRFTFLSGASSLFGFMFIFIKMAVATYDLNTLMFGILALTILTANYLYLHYTTGKAFFGIIVPIWIFIIIYESVRIFFLFNVFNMYQEYIFVLTILIFAIGYLFNNKVKLKTIKYSAMACALLNCFMLFIICYIQRPLYISLSIVALLFTGFLFIISIKARKHTSETIVIDYIVPITLWGALSLIPYSYQIDNILSLPYNFYCAVFISLISFLFIGRLSSFKKQFLYMGNVLTSLVFVIFLLKNHLLINNSEYDLIMVVTAGFLYLLSIVGAKEKTEKYIWLSVSFFSLSLANLVTGGFFISTSLFGFTALLFMIISGFYVTVKTQNSLFSVLLPMKIIMLIYQSANIISINYHFTFDKAYILLLTLLVFAIGYAFNNSKNLYYLKYSVLYCTLVNTAVLFVLCYLKRPEFISLSIIAFVFTLMLSVICLKMMRAGNDPLFVKHIVPITLWGAICLIPYSYQFYVPRLLFCIFAALFVFLLNFIFVKRLSLFKSAFLYAGSIITTTILGLTFINICFDSSRGIITSFTEYAPNYLCAFSLAIITQIYSLFSAKKQNIKYLWLYISMISLTFSVFFIALSVNINFKIDFIKYILYVAGFLIMAVYLFVKPINFKNKIAIYLAVMTGLLLISSNYMASISPYGYIAKILFVSLVSITMITSKIDIFAFIPLALGFALNFQFIFIGFGKDIAALGFILLWIIVLIIIGQLRYKLLFQNNQFDWFSLVAFAHIFLIRYQYNGFDNPHLTYLIPGLLAAIWFFVNRNRFSQTNHKIGQLFFSLSVLFPYYSVLSTYTISPDIRQELFVLPLVVLTYMIAYIIYRENRGVFLSAAVYFIPGLSYIYLLWHLAIANSILEALILGVFGFISLLYGTIFKSKSPLFIGGALLLASVIIKSKDFWTDIAWWIYLLAMGILLIVIASVNEFMKNKNNEDIFKKAGKSFDKFRNWD